VLLVEQSDRTGGVINSVTENGFTYETGPSTGVLSSLEIVELFEELHDKCELETAGKQANKRYIWKKMKWEALPSGLISAIKTPLFTLSDKFRIWVNLFGRQAAIPTNRWLNSWYAGWEKVFSIMPSILSCQAFTRATPIS